MNCRCPSEEVLQAFLAETLHESEQHTISLHVDACTLCLGKLRLLTNDGGFKAPPSRTSEAILDERGEAVLRRLKRNPVARLLLREPLRSETTGSPESETLAQQGPVRLPSIPGYEVLGELGRGGMGVVYKARQVILDRIVALKMILHADHASAAERERFLREAQAIARVQSPHIVQIHEVGEVNGTPYLCLEFCPGGSLATRLRGDPPTPAEAGQMIETIARAVQASHEQGIIHRDLKPANVLIGEKDVPKVSDFGLAKRLDAAGLTASGAIMGTPSYMAPEQVTGGAVGPAADIHALGAVLYEMLTGRPPFRAPTAAETVLQVIQLMPVAPSALQPRLPRDLETICLKCLEKEPDKRYPSAAELAEDLGRYRRGEPIRARPVGLAGRAWRWCRRHGAVASLLAVIVVLLLGGTAVSTWFAFLYKQRELEAVENVTEAIAQRNEATRQRREASRTAATVLLDQGLSFLEKGARGRGMLYLARALRDAPEDDAGLQLAIRGNLAHWQDGLWSLKTVLPHRGRVRAAAISPCGRWVATGSWDAGPQLWDLQAGREVPLSPHYPGLVAAVTFSPDGVILLTGGVDGTARLWEVQTGKPWPHPLKHPGSVWTVAFSPDGLTILTGGKDGTVRRWHARSAVPLGEPLRHGAEVFAATFSPDGKSILTGSRDRTAQLWDAPTGRPLGPPMQHPDSVKAVAFRPDGRVLATGGEDGTVRLWDAATGQAVGLPFRHQAVVRTVAFHPDGSSILSGSADRTALLWDPARRDDPVATFAHLGEVGAVAFGPEGKTILTGDANALRVWQLCSGRGVSPPLRHDADVWAVAFAPDGGSVLTGVGKADGGRGAACLWSLSRMEKEITFEEARFVSAVAFSPDGRFVLTGTRSGTARLWDCALGTPVGPLLLHDGRDRDVATINAAAFSPDGTFVLTASANGAASLWEVADGGRVKWSWRHQGQVSSVAFSPDGQIALTGGSDRLVRLWDVQSGKPVGTPLQHQDYVLSAAFGEDGFTILTGSVKGALFWDRRTGRIVGRPLPHDRGVSAVALNRDCTLAITGSADRTARVWATQLGRPLGPPLRHLAPINGVAIHPQGTFVLTGSADQTARLWRVPAPVRGDSERIVFWVQTLVGAELQEGGEVRVLDANAWNDCRIRLEGLGGPLP